MVKYLGKSNFGLLFWVGGCVDWDPLFLIIRIRKSESKRKMSVRAIIAVLDSLGVGASDDAANFGDVGADTFGHIANQCASGKANSEGHRCGQLQIPNLAQLGLVHLAEASTGRSLKLPNASTLTGRYGYAAERSFGKDTPSGHWEIAGVPTEFDWGFFTDKEKSFPSELLANLIGKASLTGVLGNKHASGTTIIEELGEAHIETEKPIVYTSGDSVFQIAAHEQHFGLERLYKVCEIARQLVDEFNISRVIARPFVGSPEEGFTRTGNRRDYATPPHQPTLLDRLIDDGGEVISIGKVADIFAHQGISKTVKAHGNEAIFDTLLGQMKAVETRSILFANFVDFDTLYGHRRDVAGYAKALEDFDIRLPELLTAMREDDLLIITADHGCDPTWPGSDHTREHVPVLAYGHSLTPGFIGKRATFADMGQSIAEHLKLDPLPNGVSFLNEPVQTNELAHVS